MRVNVAIPDHHVNAPTLDAALEATTRLNESMLAAGEIPSFEKALMHGVRWRPEPPGGEYFDHGGLVMQRGWGDCDDLAPLHAASLRHSGKDPQAKAIVQRKGPSLWHAVVRRGDGTIDDPSKRAGMGPGVAPGNRGATVPLIAPPAQVVGGAFMMRPQLAMRLLRPRSPESEIEARTDIPWFWQKGPNDPITPGNVAMATLHAAPVASTALTGCIDGACRLALAGEYAEEEHLSRLSALADCIEGADWQELAAEYGQDAADAAVHVVGSFFGGLAKMVSHAMPLASTALQFIPGVGPIASKALDIARAHLPFGEQAAHAAAAIPHPDAGLMHPDAASLMHPAASMMPHGHSGRLCVPATFE